MLKNYLRVALRNLTRDKAFSFINISGFAVGVACCIAIMLFMQDELSYDRFNEFAKPDIPADDERYDEWSRDQRCIKSFGNGTGTFYRFTRSNFVHKAKEFRLYCVALFRQSLQRRSVFGRRFLIL